MTGVLAMFSSELSVLLWQLLPTGFLRTGFARNEGDESVEETAPSGSGLGMWVDSGTSRFGGRLDHPESSIEYKRNCCLIVAFSL